MKKTTSGRQGKGIVFGIVLFIAMCLLKIVYGL